mmetsp:Transcript_35886/g.43216  ORF Transcript_35886/g.43216 Transcript_35886/m.43216 type:complete len:2035 (-) Transcript_35886:445-6549(-)
MGQRHGKTLFHEDAIAFINLPFMAIEEMWSAFNDIADGWGLNLQDFKAICAVLVTMLGYGRSTMDILSAKLFKLYDTDENGLVDAIEFLSSIVAASGMSKKEKLLFIFKYFDFNNCDSLTVDEVTLAIRSALVGLNKLDVGDDKPPTDDHLETQVIQMWSGNDISSKITIEIAVNFCTKSPECMSWIDFYDNPQESTLYAEKFTPPKESEEDIASTLRNLNISNSTTWMENVEELLPSQFSGHNFSSSAPSSSNLQLEWVHGYNHNTTCFYTVDDKICYTSGKIGIVANTSEHRQQHYFDHDGPISSVAFHRSYVATGEIYFNPKIIVWDTKTLKSLSVMRGFHKKGISQLAFNLSGCIVASVGSDHYLSVFDWKKCERLYSSLISLSRSTDVTFGHDDTIVSCGVNHMFFWTHEKHGKHNYQKKSAIFGRRFAKQTQLVLKNCRDKILSGTESGHIYVWIGRNCVDAIKAHDGPCYAIDVSDYAIVTGGDDCKVRIWTLSLKKGAVFDLRSFGAEPKVRALCLFHDTSKICLGTAGSEIYEISTSDGCDINRGPIATGHFHGKLLGLTIHPLKPEFCTVGDDKTVRIWDIASKHIIRYNTTHTAAGAVAFAPNGERLVVGHVDGSFAILDNTLHHLHSSKDANGAILDIKFAIDGKLAISSEDEKICLYDIEHDKVSKLRTIRILATSMDFSTDGTMIQATTADNEGLVFICVDTGDIVDSFSAAKDICWNTHTIPAGWFVNGVCAEFPSSPFSIDRSESEEILAAGDFEGRVHLFRYPCPTKSRSNAYVGHSGPVSKVRFTNGDDHLISIGLIDRCVLQWKHVFDDSDEESDGSSDSESIYSKLDYDDTEPQQKVPIEKLGHIEFHCIEADLPPLKPEGMIRGPPLNDYRYAFNGGRVCYSASDVFLIYDKSSGKQFYKSFAVSCWAISPCRNYVALCGGTSSSIIFFDTNTIETLSVIENISGEPMHAAFSPAELFAVLSKGERGVNQISIFNWMQGDLKYHGYGKKFKTNGINFSSSSKLLQFGLKRVLVWNIWNVSGRNPTFNDIKADSEILSMSSGNYPLIYFGDNDGHLFTLDEGVISKFVDKAHDASINCMSHSSEPRRLVTGSSDGIIKIWSFDSSDILFDIDLKKYIDAKSANFSPLSIDGHYNNNKLVILVWCPDGELKEFLEDGTLLNGTIISGHTTKAWALASHPSKNQFVSCCEDGTVRLWIPESARHVAIVHLELRARSCDYSYDNGKHIVIGTGGKLGDTDDSGMLVVVDPNNLKPLHFYAVSQEPIVAVKYSPCKKILGAASIGISCIDVYLYDVKNEFWLTHKLTSSNLIDISSIVLLTFSSNGEYLRLADRNSPFFFAETGHGTPIPDGDVLTGTSWCSTSGYSANGLIWSCNDSFAVSLSESGSIFHWKKLSKGNVSSSETNRVSNTSCIIAEKRPQNVDIQSYNPAALVQLEHVHGCPLDMHSCIKYNAQEEIVYFVGGIGIIYSLVDGVQRFHHGHHGAITCLAISPSGTTIATAEIGTQLRVWCAMTGTIIAELPTLDNGAERVIFFSSDGKYLACAGRNNMTTVYFHVNEKWRLFASGPCGQDCSNCTLSFALFIGEKNFPILLGNSRNFYIVSVIGDKTLGFTYIPGNQSEDFTCASQQNCNTFVGGSSGSLFNWEYNISGMSFNAIVKAHEGALTCVVFADGNQVITGGSDGKVKFWNSNSMVNKKVYSVTEPATIIRSVCINPSATKLLVGTDCAMFQFSIFESSSALKVNETHEGGTGGLNSICWNPVDDKTFAIVGDDAILRIWTILSVGNHKLTKKKKLDGASQACSWSPNGNFICVGLCGSGEGAFSVLNNNSLETEIEDRKAKKSIRDIKYHTSGSIVAMASADGRIYIHDAKTYKLLRTTEKHSIPIYSIDLADKFIRALSESGTEIITVSFDNGNIISLEDTEKVEWQTNSCDVEWVTPNLMKHCHTDEKITSIDKSESKICFATSHGNIYVCDNETALNVCCVARNSTRVSRVLFNKSGDMIVSIGKYNRSIMVFNVKS